MGRPARVVTGDEFVQHLMSGTGRFSIVMSGYTTVHHDFSIGPRVIDEHLLFYLESGSIRGAVGDREMESKPRQFYWQQPDVGHQLVHNPGYEAVGVYYFRVELQAPERLRLSQPYLLVNDYHGIGAVMGQILPLCARPDRLSQLRLRCLFGDVFCQALSTAEHHEERHASLQPHQERLALTFIHENLSRRYPVRELAEHLKLNPDYFSRRFRASFGKTPQQFIKEERIRLSCDLLHSNATISEVAYQLGYDDLAFYSRQFKSIMQQSPARWRRHHAPK